MKKTYFVPLVLSFAFLISTLPAFGQDSGITADELFQWFPESNYQYIFHTDKFGLETAEKYPVYLEYFAGRNKDFLPTDVLPDSFEDNYESRTIVNVAKFKVHAYKREKFEKMVRASGGRIGDKNFIYENIGDLLYVYRFADLDGLMTQARKDGEVSDTSTIVFKRPVFTYNVKDKESVKTVFAWTTSTQELLVAESLAGLKKMIAAGTGQSSQMLDDPDYTVLHELVPELGETWHALNFATNFRIRLALLINNDASDEEIEKHRDAMGKTNDLNIKSWTVADEFRGYTYYIYRSEEWAELAEERHRPKDNYVADPSQADVVNAYDKAVWERKTVTRSGGIVKIVRLYDDEVMEKWRLSYAHWKERQEKAKKEKETSSK